MVLLETSHCNPFADEIAVAYVRFAVRTSTRATVTRATDQIDPRGKLGQLEKGKK